MTSATSSAYLPSPDFTFMRPGSKIVAGLRPYRLGSYRLEHEMVGDKFVVHNYGHGGAGITMSWGCADSVATIVRAHSSPMEKKAVAILGYGVMGLTVATLLAPDYKVSIYAELSKPTTSDIAGGQWAPSVVEYDEKSTKATNDFRSILVTAFRMHEQRIGQGFGVSRRTNYTQKKSDTFAKVPEELIPDPGDKPGPLPFEHITSGFEYPTLLVEPPIFLTKLRNDLRDRHVVPQHKVFRNVADVRHLPEPIIINCTGLGSKKLFKDPNLEPIKGQLVLLPAQPNLEWLYSTDQTYVFPRADYVVVGGSYEYGATNEKPSPTRCEKIRKNAEDVFAGRAIDPKLKDAPWLMRNK